MKPFSIIIIVIIIISFTITTIIIFTIVAMGFVDWLNFPDPNSCPKIAPQGALYSLM